MSTGPEKAFRDAFTDLAEHSLEPSPIVRPIQINASTTTSTLNEIPVDVNAKYPSVAVGKDVPQRGDQPVLCTRKDFIFVEPPKNEVSNSLKPKVSPLQSFTLTLPSFKTMHADRIGDVSMPLPKRESSSRSFKSRSTASISMDESSFLPPPDESSVYSLHSDASLYALPKWMVKDGRKPKSLCLPPDGEQNVNWTVHFEV